MTKKKQKKRVKAGGSRVSTESRRLPFVHAYLNNGKNISQAALSIGCSPKSAHTLGHRLFKNVATQALIKQEEDRLSAASGLTVERTLRELARLAYQDPRKLYDKDGMRIPIHLLDDDTAATIAGVEDEEQVTTVGKKKSVASFIRKTKHWDKNSALEKAMKYHKLYADGVAPTGAAVIIIQASALDKAI